MKLTNIVLHPENSFDDVKLNFRDPNGTNPYNVKSVIGLDASEIEPRYYGASGSSKFYNLSLENREIVFRIGLNPIVSEFKSYSDLRSDLYKLIASSRTGQLQVQLKNNLEILAVISGFISKFETSLFEKVQEVQITITCDETMFKSINPEIISGFSSTISNIIIRDSKSTAPHGFKFDMNVLDDIDSIIFTDPYNTSWSFEIAPLGGFLSGDVLFLSSEQNNKYIYLVREDSIFHLADMITAGSVWPMIFPGDNTFALNHPTSLVWNTVSHYLTYWGV